MVRRLGHDPGPMVVNRVGEGHWMFLDMKTREELIVSLDSRGRPRPTVYIPQINPPIRPEMGMKLPQSAALTAPPSLRDRGAMEGAGACGAGSGRGGTSTTDTCCI